jgi:ABC-type bacteriocin/lantibiotic exporter with double-glycine peptidase domain
LISRLVVFIDENTKLNLIRKVLILLSPRERRDACLLVALILVMAALDVIGVASVMPFMAVLANPDAVEANKYLSAAYARFGFANKEQFLFFLGLMVFVALVSSILFKALTTWALLRYTHMREYSLGIRLVAGYLRQPYEWFLSRHSADLSKSVLSEVQEVVVGALIPLLQLLAQGAVVIALLMLLILADPLLALYIGVGLGVGYGGLYMLLRRRLARLGKEREEANRSRFEILSEAFGGIKELKLAGLEEVLIRRYKQPAKQCAKSITAAQLAKQLPRYALEIIAFGGMLLVVLYLMRTRGSFEGALPLIALYAFGSYRLMPALQQVYAHMATLRFAEPALNNLYADLVQIAPAQSGESILTPLSVEKSIALREVTYAYPNSQVAAVHNLSLEIPARATVGLVGSTGSGKTTTVDIILGLLLPYSGRLEIDGVPIGPDNLRAWQRNLGYVPQHIYLAADTVAGNIAFGVPREEIDLSAVERAARIANLHDFVVNDMPQGYNTQVGERGVCLSGGQRQRVGIARALYHKPQVLVLDEATSALDNLTEQSVMEAVHNLSHEVTIIIIAHRLSTVRECDCIYILEKGGLVGEGNYDELVRDNPQFRRMTQVGALP